MNIPSLIARRYLKPRRISIVSIIGIVSVVGIVIGTAALIVVMSLFNGLRNVATDLMIGFGPHVQILSSAGSRISNPNDVVNYLDQIAKSELARLQVTGRTETIQTRLVVQTAGKTGIIQAVGIHPHASPLYKGQQLATIIGTFSPFPVDGTSSIVIAAGIAEHLRLFIGDTLTLITPEMIERSILTMSVPNGRQAVVRGIFQSNTARTIDNSFAYTDYKTLALLTRNTAPSSIDIYVHNPRDVDEIKESLQNTLNLYSKQTTTKGIPQASNEKSPSYEVQTWQDLNKGLVDTMKLEKIGTFIVLALIVLVASFNVLVSLTLGVVEKRRDIAVLLTMGLLPSDIQRIYVIQGLTIGSISVMLGILIGVGICVGQQTFHWISFDVNKGYLVPWLPVEMHASNIIIIACIGLILAGTAALYPAHRASKTNISDAIRVE